MDCTVDSMFTTTPFLSPREGCEPTPSTSICPSAATSPTRATTLDVPISRPTIRPLSERLDIASQPVAFGRSGAPPADCEAVGVAHVSLDEPPLRREITLRHQCFLAIRSRELRELRRHVARFVREQLAASVE